MSKKLAEWIRANRVRISVAGAVCYWQLNFLVEFPYFLIRQISATIYNPWFTIIYLIIFASLSLALVSVAWFVADLLPNVATSLGYSKELTYEVNIQGAGNTIHVPPQNTSKQVESSFPDVLALEYNKDNMLSPLDNARFRMLDHIAKLRNNSVINLIVGIAIAGFGVIVLATAFFQINTSIDPVSHTFDTRSFVLTVLMPRLSITIFVQIFAFFFLVMYRSNQSDIKYFQNEITLVDSLATAVIAGQGTSISASMKGVLVALSRNERNRVMKKGEIPFGHGEEAELLRAMTLLSQLTKIRKSLDDED